MSAAQVRSSLYICDDGSVHHAVLDATDPDVAIALTGVYEGPRDEQSKEDAMRIALMWNLLSPFTTEELTHGIDLVKLVQQINEQKAVISRLESALKETASKMPPPLPEGIQREYDRICRRDMNLQNKQDIVSPGRN